MFERFQVLPPDPILGISVAYAADPAKNKIDVGVGVYRDEQGHTPVMQAVLRAEEHVAATQTTKSYVGTAGNAAFNAAITELVLGPTHEAVTAGRMVALQTPGGCGALRLAADLVRSANAEAVVAVSAPTWPHHAVIMGGALLKVAEYPYYDAATHTLLFGPMLAALEALPEGSVVLLQPSCHNPTGADLNAEQWREVAAVLERRRLLPLLDIAYQGLGDGLDADAAALRTLCATLPEVLVTVSCSKNFGLYRERTGAILYVGRSPGEVRAVHTHLMMLARRLYSMAPDHGAAVVGALWNDAALRALWRSEVDTMRERLNALRSALSAELGRVLPGREMGFIGRQRGMFSLLGLNATAVERLRSECHVYCAPDSRINIAGLSAASIAPLAQAIATVSR